MGLLICLYLSLCPFVLHLHCIFAHLDCKAGPGGWVVIGLVAALRQVGLNVGRLHAGAGVTLLVLGHPGARFTWELFTDDTASDKQALEEHLKKLSSGRNMFEFDTALVKGTEFDSW